MKGQPRIYRKRTPVKYWPFDGTEKWKVWHKRFEVGTQGWPEDEKLEALLQLMKGPAAVFVFD